MRRLLWVLPVAFFLLNPSLACGPPDPEFQYGAKEMRAAVEGDWAFMLTPSDGAPVQVTVHVEQAPALMSTRSPVRGDGLIRSAQACGTRTLIKGADACIDATQMPLTLTFLAGDPSFAASGTTLTGNFMVESVKFDWGMMMLRLGSYDVEVDVNADGTIRFARPSQTGLSSVEAGRL